VSPGVARLTDENLGDIQGFITSGYGHLPLVAYLFVRMHDAGGGRRWIEALAPSVSSSRPWPVTANGKKVKPASAVNVAFTAPGLVACGVPERVMCTFPAEFQEGIAAQHRSPILGDTEDSAPARWEIGGPANEFHALVFIYAQDEAELERVCGAQRALLEQTSGAVIELPDSLQRGYRPASDSEHFGFHDGIAQPSIAGIAQRGVPTGEFILGYENHYGVIPPTPVVPGDLDPTGVLPAFANPYHAALTLRDLGRHGSYVVFRKLQQNVAAFWTFMKQEAIRSGGGADPAAYMVWLASKCVGRWPGGAPLTMSPDLDDPMLANSDDFLYASDPDGLRCPLGAHVRRSNPRDVIKPYAPEQSLHMSEAHRLLRRGRTFGPPLFDPTLLGDPSTDAARCVLLELRDDGQPRGVHFFCVNANIRSQFEFVQQTWCNNPRFGGLHDNKDPVAGDHGGNGQPASYMTIPGRSSSERTSALPRVVTVSAGAYLFMPSLAALRFLARQRTSGSAAAPV
jgi:Dyp-type peroxidase family